MKEKSMQAIETKEQFADSLDNSDTGDNRDKSGQAQEKVKRPGKKTATRMQELRNFFGFSEAQFAAAIGCNGRPVNWEWEPLTREMSHAIYQLEQVHQILLGLLTPKGIKHWLHTPKAFLKGRTPVEAIVQGELNPVLEQLIRVEEGIHT